MVRKKQVIKVKGTREGLVIAIDDNTAMDTVLDVLKNDLKKTKDFLQGAEVIIEIGKRQLTPEEADLLTKLLKQEKELRIKGFRRGSSQEAQTKITNREQDKESNKDKANTAPTMNTGDIIDKDKTNELQIEKEDTETLFIRRTLRSGQSVHYQGNVVVIGDVNPGAEIIAGGDIIVMGTFRGMAHAGATGDQSAIAAALRLRPTQLRIADVITRCPDDDGDAPDRPEVAMLRQGNIIIEEYLAASKRFNLGNEERNVEFKEEWRWAR